ncbi:MAG: energy-coupling factor transporter ATPase [Acidobacteriota bacterium]
MKAIEIQNLSFQYKSLWKRALDSISVSIEEGEFAGIFGATGAGKSSLVRVINRIIPSFFKGNFLGSVKVRGSDCSGKRIPEMSSTVGMVFQEFESQLFSTNVEHEIAFGCENLGVEKGEISSRIKRYIEFSGLRGFERRSPSSLSGGEKQRLAIASVLAISTPIVVMDEPTTDLDPLGKKSIFELLSRLKEEQRTIVLVEHETEEAFLLDRLIVMDAGKVIAEGNPQDILYEVDFLMEKGIRPPDMALLNARLKASGILRENAGEIPHRVEEAFRFLKSAGVVPIKEKYEKMMIDKRIRNAGSIKPGYQEEIISVHDLHFRYEGEREALSAVNLSIKKGEFIAILGANGSGKTTLAKHFNGLLKPTSGNVFFSGRNVSLEHVSSMGKNIGYIFQNPDHQIFSQTVEEEVGFGPGNFGFSHGEIKDRVRDSLRTVGLEGREKEDPFAMTKGERQKVAVASIIASSPEVIIMDEPTTGLDYNDQKRIMAILRRLNDHGHTIIIITHSIWLAAEYARRVIVMKDGCIIRDGFPEEVFEDDAALAEGNIEVPAITKLSKRFGIVALSVDDFIRCLRQGHHYPEAV